MQIYFPRCIILPTCRDTRTSSLRLDQVQDLQVGRTRLQMQQHKRGTCTQNNCLVDKFQQHPRVSLPVKTEEIIKSTRMGLFIGYDWKG